ncbi:MULTISPECIES: hypothetical protein [Streptomyces]|uniref:hypothetical protein n=1 Tax=Streptomyces TaxID=1883 RepID=UPI00131EB648|nr:MULTISPECIES: hypothetical protein [Streptomyces]
MRTFFQTKPVSVLLAAATLSLVFPNVANAASADGARSQKSPAYSNSCATGMAVSLYNGLKIRAQPKNNATVIATAGLNDPYPCQLDTVRLGDRYNGCGVYNANGWLIIQIGPERYGYSAMTCWRDA